MKIRIGNDFKTKWAITWLGEPEDFSDATDISLSFNIYDKKIELIKDVDYTITDNIIEIDVTPDICNILGVYNLELHYTKPNNDFIDGERRSAVDIDAFRIVGKSEKADSTQDVSIISDAVAIFLDIAYKKLEEIEANEDVRILNEGEREDAESVRVVNENIRISNEQDRQINTATAISNAEQATLNANNSAVYANEQGAYAEEMSSHPPTIINDYWHIWNFTTNQYESTGQYARGDSAVEGALVLQEKGQSAVNTMSQKAVTDELVQLAGDVSKKSKYPYEDGFPFSQLVIDRGVDNFLIDAYFDFDYEDGYRYSFSTIDARSGTLKAAMFKHPEGLPPSGNIVLVATYTFTKEANNKYYTGKSSARPNDWVIANLDIIQPDEVWYSMYYTDGVGLSPRLFKNGIQKPIPLQTLGASETQPVSQKKITEEINTINSKLVPFDPDTLTISNAKISDISYIHPNGMVEYEGNADNYPQPAVGTYLAPQGKKLLVRRIKFGIYIPPTAVGMVKVYKGLTLSANPSAHTLVEEINVTDRAAVDQLQEIVLSEDLILQGNEYLYVYFVCESTDLPYPRIRRWNISGEARPSILFSLGLATWHIGGATYYTTPLLTYSSASGVADITELSAKVLDHEERIEVIESFVPENSLIDISLPDTIYAIVGDKLQLFYRGMIAHPYPYIYNIVVNCSKGKQYPRYFEYLPTVEDIGTTTFKVEVKDKDGNILGSKTCNLITKAAVQSPTTDKKILCVGDSLTSAGIWCIEASRRLIGSGGTPAGLGLTNISFLGRKTGSGIGWEGTGGWTWSQYAFAGVPAYKFYVSGVMTAPSIGATYTNNGVTYTISEVNITSGTGYVSATGTGAPTASGSLTKLSGGGDVALEFSSSEADAGNPFWESDTNSLDFPQYVNTYMNGSCDVIYFLLSWNGQHPNRTDFSSMTTYAKVLIDHIHTEYPNCKMKIMGVQVPSLNGGMGANYGADGTGLSDTYGMVVTALNMNKAYQDWCNEPAYSSFLEFVNISSQFDSENNMPESDVPVNSRSSKTEKIGTNGLHPSTAGYYQIADVVFRNFVANFCQ